MQREWVELVVSTASQAALTGSMGAPSEADQQLEETAALSLPLLLPEDGYSCDSQQEGGALFLLFRCLWVGFRVGTILDSKIE